MSPENLVTQFVSLLEPLADNARAESMSAYLLHRYDFLGIPAPVRRTEVKELVKASQPDAAFVINSAELLWEREAREYRYAAIDFLKQHVKLLSAADILAIKNYCNGILRGKLWTA